MEEKIDRDKMIERIKALLALGDKTQNDSEGEVNAAMKKVQELLSLHNLSISEINSNPKIKKVGVEVVDEMSKEFRKSSMSTWEGSLASLVGLATDTKAYYHQNHVPGTVSGKITKVRYIGAVWDVAVAVEMYRYLHSHIKRLSIKNYPDKSSDQRSFMEGCCDRLGQRIREQNELFRNQQHTNQGFALLVVSKKDAIEAYSRDVLKMRPPKSTRFGKGEHNSFAYLHGMKEANKMDIGNEKRLQ